MRIPRFPFLFPHLLNDDSDGLQIVRPFCNQIIQLATKLGNQRFQLDRRVVALILRLQCQLDQPTPNRFPLDDV